MCFKLKEKLDQSGKTELNKDGSPTHTLSELKFIYTKHYRGNLMPGLNGTAFDTSYNVHIYDIDWYEDNKNNKAETIEGHIDIYYKNNKNTKIDNIYYDIKLNEITDFCRRDDVYKSTWKFKIDTNAYTNWYNTIASRNRRDFAKQFWDVFHNNNKSLCVESELTQTEEVKGGSARNFRTSKKKIKSSHRRTHRRRHGHSLRRQRLSRKR